MNADHDRELVTRLRAATEVVPPSGLDLDDVLRGARAKARRARAVTGVAVVMALGLSGAGVAEVGSKLVAPPAVDDTASRSLGAAAPGCPDGRPLNVTFSGHAETASPVLVALARTTFPTAGSGTVDTKAMAAHAVWDDVMVDYGLSENAVVAPSAPTWYRAEILAQAERAEAPLVPVPPSPRPGGSATDGLTLLGAVPGATYLAYSAGTSVSTDGEAGCGSERTPFRLEYTTVSETGVLQCGVPLTGSETTAARNALTGYCPFGAGAAPAH
jgi:hypothetical protein